MIIYMFLRKIKKSCTYTLKYFYFDTLNNRIELFGFKPLDIRNRPILKMLPKNVFLRCYVSLSTYD